MDDELTSKMHSELYIDSETEISHRVGIIVEELNDGGTTLNELLEEYGVSLEQYNKYKSIWENV